jgi:hypothetical protein
VVYNPITLLKVREAVGEEIGTNCDLTHLFWSRLQRCGSDSFPWQAEYDLSRAHEGYGSISGECRKMLRVEFVFEKSDLPSAPGAFRAAGYGHGAATWQAII